MPQRHEDIMGMGAAFITCMKKYADFSGRARRSEFWWFYLAVQIIMLPFVFAFIVAYVALLASLETTTRADGTVTFDADGANFGPLIAVTLVMMVVSLVFTLPSYAATVRRLHDMGQSGMWVLLNFVGLGIVATIMCIMDTQPGTNQWGPDPKAGERVNYGYPPASYPPAYPTITPNYPTITPNYPTITPPSPPSAPPFA